MEHYDIISWNVHVFSFGEGRGEGGEGRGGEKGRGGGEVRWGEAFDFSTYLLSYVYYIYNILSDVMTYLVDLMNKQYYLRECK